MYKAVCIWIDISAVVAPDAVANNHALWKGWQQDSSYSSYAEHVLNDKHCFQIENLFSSTSSQLTGCETTFAACCTRNLNSF